MLLFPFAKINLGLAVLEKRADGFHALESLLHPIDLFDIIELVESDKDELSISGNLLNLLPKDNLVWKALNLLRNHYDFPPIKIHLHKQIPSGAGLGGGSSDAAHTLLGINQLFNLDINNFTLAKLAAEIGSDCPFFLNQKAQYAKGRGEILKPFELNLQAQKLVLVIPDFSISTKTAYSNLIPENPITLPIEALQMPIEKWNLFLKNDFEKTVFKDFPTLSSLKEILYKNGAIYTSLSGSGSGIYGMFSAEKTIEIPKNYQAYWLDF